VLFTDPSRNHRTGTVGSSCSYLLTTPTTNPICSLSALEPTALEHPTASKILLPFQEV